eukprot:6207357-Pleurochrysis_carterae.AAC.2
MGIGSACALSNEAGGVIDPSLVRTMWNFRRSCRDSSCSRASRSRCALSRSLASVMSIERNDSGSQRAWSDFVKCAGSCSKNDSKNSECTCIQKESKPPR